MMFKRFLVTAGAAAVMAAALPASAQTAPPNWRPVSPHPHLQSSATPWLGVSLERLSPYYRRYYRVPFQYGGVLVRSVARRSPAARAGIRTGDVIVRIDGKYMYRPLDVVRQVRASRAGQRIRVDLYRFGAWKLFTVKLGRARSPHRTPADPFARPPVRRPPTTPGWITRIPGPRGRAIRQLLKQIAQLKREVQTLKRKVAKLEQQVKGRKTASPASVPKTKKTTPRKGGGNVPPPPPPGS